MIDPLISAWAQVLQWIITVIYYIALGFQTVAGWCQSIPGVGGNLSAAFKSVQSLFNDFGYNVAHFQQRSVDALNAIDDRLDWAAGLGGDVYGWISDKLDDAYAWAKNAIGQIPDLWDEVEAILDQLHSPLEVFYWVANYLGINRKSGESWWGAIVRTIGEALDVINLPTLDEILTWIMNKLGIYQQSGESWWDAFIRTIGQALGSFDPSTWGDKILEAFGIYRQPGESVWDAIMRTIVEWVPGLAGIVNFWNFWFEDLNLFFGDPPAYFEKKLTEVGETFAERFWALVEAILERIW